MDCFRLIREISGYQKRRGFHENTLCQRRLPDAPGQMSERPFKTKEFENETSGGSEAAENPKTGPGGMPSDAPDSLTAAARTHRKESGNGGQRVDREEDRAQGDEREAGELSERGPVSFRHEDRDSLVAAMGCSTIAWSSSRSRVAFRTS